MVRASAQITDCDFRQLQPNRVLEFPLQPMIKCSIREMNEERTLRQTAHSRTLREKKLQRACWWLKAGVSLVPIRPRSKHLFRGFGPQKSHITDFPTAKRWFLDTDANLGVVLGGTAGLIVADWDRVHDYQVWRSSRGAKIRTLTERTTRGYHLYFYGHGFHSSVGEGCEFKTDGVCTVSPSIHPSGYVYQIICDAPILRLTSETAVTLFPFLSQDRQKSESSIPVDRDVVRTHPEKSKKPPTNGSLVERIKQIRSISDEMETAGVRLRPGGQNALVGLCPFHKDHQPSLWANPESGLWGCNRPDCVAAGIHDVINFRSLILGISNRDAIRLLAREFLGK